MDEQLDENAEELVDNFENESVDYGEFDDFDYRGPVSVGPMRNQRAALSMIPEESREYITASRASIHKDVSSFRGESPFGKRDLSPFAMDRDRMGSGQSPHPGGEDSFGNLGSGTSFKCASNSEDSGQFHQGNALNIINQAQDSFEKKGHNLFIPVQKSFFEKENSWEPSPYRPGSSPTKNLENQLPLSPLANNGEITPKRPSLAISRGRPSLAEHETTPPPAPVSSEVPSSIYSVEVETVKKPPAPSRPRLMASTNRHECSPTRQGQVASAGVCLNNITASEFNVTMTTKTSTPKAANVPRPMIDMSMIAKEPPTVNVREQAPCYRLQRQPAPPTSVLAPSSSAIPVPTKSAGLEMSAVTDTSSTLSDTKMERLADNLLREKLNMNAEDLRDYVNHLVISKLKPTSILPPPKNSQYQYGSNRGSSSLSLASTQLSNMSKSHVHPEPNISALRKFKVPSEEERRASEARLKHDSGLPESMRTNPSRSSVDDITNSMNKMSVKDLRDVGRSNSGDLMRCPSVASSRASTAMSTASTVVSSDIAILKLSTKRIVFGFLDANMSISQSFSILNRSNERVVVQMQFRSERTHYELKDANCIRLEPQESSKVAVTFKPKSTGRINDALYIKIVGRDQQYTIYLRGYGGTAKIGVSRSSDIESCRGIHTLTVPSPFVDRLSFTLKSEGVRNAFCKVLLLVNDVTTISPRRVYPAANFIMKKHQRETVNIEFEHGHLQRLLSEDRSRFNSTVSSVGSVGSRGREPRLRIRIIWGEDLQLYRLQCLALSVPQLGTVDGVSYVEDFYGSDLENFKAPEEYPLDRDDFMVFKHCLRYTDIDVICNAFNPHLCFEGGNVTVPPDDTLFDPRTRSRNRCEATVVKDVDETLR